MEKNLHPPPYEKEFNNPGYGSPHRPTAPGSSNSQGPNYNMGGGQMYPPYQPPPPQPPQQPIVIHSPPPAQPVMHQVIVTGGGALPGCPICHNNSWTSDYPCCGWCLAIICFPIGIICCCCMKRKRCTQCGYIVG